MVLTKKQKDILRTIWLGHEREQLLTIDETVDLLPYNTTKQSLQFSIRALIKKGLVVKEELVQDAPTVGQYKRQLALSTLGKAAAKRIITG